MATHSIGTGGDFSTVQAWEDDVPATLIENRIGQVKNEELVVAGTVLSVSNHVTGAFTFILEAVPGGSFRDHANVRTNPLKYDATKGASLRSSSGNVECISLQVGNIADIITIRNLQIKADAAASYNHGLSMHGGHYNFDNLILESNSSRYAIYTDGSAEFALKNSAVIARTGISAMAHNSGGDWSIIGCTIVRPSDLGGTPVLIYQQGYDRTNFLQNNLILGFTSHIEGGASNTTGDYNATDLSDAASNLPGTHGVYSLPFDTTTVVGPLDATRDFRLVAGCAAENAGLYDGTNSPNDITGLAHATPPEIGAWELAAAAATPLFGQIWMD